MLSINTNLSSLIAQQSMSSATNKLNQAIERMTTGYKINGAKDNAANYSISQNMQTQLGSYDVAADNVAMGMDLVTTASDIINNMQDKATRLQALCTQARNGTYGAQSMLAINSEAAAIMSEITRLYQTAEYNGISLFNNRSYEIDSSLPQAGDSGFIEEPVATYTMRAAATPTPPVAKEEYKDFIEDPKTYEDSYVDALTSVSEAIAAGSLTNGGEYKVASADDLKALATYTNNGKSTYNITFILSEDIDLSGETNWTPIGDYANVSKVFSGNFDGNGHVIKNLTINNDTQNYQGLFGRVMNGTGIKNLGLENVQISGKDYVGGVAGESYVKLENCYVTGNVTAERYAGGLVGEQRYQSITNCYTTTDVTSTGYGRTGGLVGYTDSAENYYDTAIISNCYTTGNIICNNSSDIGGLVGWNEFHVDNCYTTGNVTGKSEVGGLIGWLDVTERGKSLYLNVTNCYTTGDVIGISNVGGLVGYDQNPGSHINCYSTGDVSGTNYVGGLLGYSLSASVENCYATGDITGKGTVGGLIGVLTNGYQIPNSINNCYATGDVIATGESSDSAGGLVASISTATVTNCYAEGNVTSAGQNTGGFVGKISSYYGTTTTIANSYSTGNVTGNTSTGGFAGSAASNVENCYSTGSVTGSTATGGFAGSLSSNGNLENCYSTGNVIGETYTGGLVGTINGNINNCYTTGDVKGTSGVGGFGGYSNNVNISNSASYSKVSGEENVGAVIGEFCTGDITVYNYGNGDEGVRERGGGTVTITDCKTASNNLPAVAIATKNVNYDIYYTDPDTGEIVENYDRTVVEDTSFDTTVYEACITAVNTKPVLTNLQVGINSDSSCQISFDTNFQFDLSSLEGNIASDAALSVIMEFSNLLSEKSTQLGAVQNRLDSAIESITVNMENLTSSLSTIRDADIAEVSSQYIQQQILQQASATLLATANQSPSIALQLI